MIAAVLLRRVLWTVVVVLSSAAAAGAQVRIVQTNSAGDNIHLIDPVTNTIVGEVKGVPINHGAAALPDGSRLFFSSEAEQTLHVVDGKTLQTTKKIPLTGRPNNISISKDGARVYVGIVSAPGAVDVIDTKTLEKAKSIPTKGGIHNVYVTPDGRHVVAGSIAGRVMTVIDQKTEEPLWTLFEEGVRPMAFEVEPGRFDEAYLRSVVERPRVRHRRLPAPQGSWPHHVARRRPGGESGQGSVQRVAVARHGRCARREDALGDEPAERTRIYVLAAGSEAAAEPGRPRRPARLGHVHPGQQADLHHHREHGPRSCHRRVFA